MITYIWLFITILVAFVLYKKWDKIQNSKGFPYTVIVAAGLYAVGTYVFVFQNADNEVSGPIADFTADAAAEYEEQRETEFVEDDSPSVEEISEEMTEENRQSNESAIERFRQLRQTEE